MTLKSLSFPKSAGDNTDDPFLYVEVPAIFRNDIVRAKQNSETELRQIVGDFIFAGMQGSKCRMEENGRTWGNSAALRFFGAEESTDMVVRFALSLEAGKKLLGALHENEGDLDFD